MWACGRFSGPVLVRSCWSSRAKIPSWFLLATQHLNDMFHCHALFHFSRENDFRFLVRTRLHDEYRHSITFHVSLRLFTHLIVCFCSHVTHTHTHTSFLPLLAPPTDRHPSSPESVHETTSHRHTRIGRQRYVLRRTLNCSRAWVLGRTLNCSRNVSWAGR